MPPTTLIPAHRSVQLRRLAGAALLVACGAASAATGVPTQDLKGLSDPPGITRYSGSVLLYRSDAA